MSGSNGIQEERREEPAYTPPMGKCPARAAYMSDHWGEIVEDVNNVSQFPSVAAVARHHHLPATTVRYHLGLEKVTNPKTGEPFSDSATVSAAQRRRVARKVREAEALAGEASFERPKRRRKKPIVEAIPEEEDVGALVLDAFIGKLKRLEATNAVLREENNTLRAKLAEVKLEQERMEQSKEKRRQRKIEANKVVHSED